MTVKRRSANDEEEGIACQPLPKSFPSNVREVPLRVVVALQLTEYNCVNRSFYEKFAVDSVEQAMLRLMQYRDMNLIFSFMMSGANPAFSRDADWPVFRGRSTRTTTPRHLNSTGAPWNLVSDRTVFEIRNDPLTYWTTRMYLRAGGIDDADAALRWDALAKPLRLLRTSVLAEIAAGTTTLAGV